MSKIIPINNSSIINSSTNISTIKTKNEFPIPIINDDNDIIIEVNSIGLPGPIGKTGNGIDKIEKTSTSGLIDTYTIYFTNGTYFQYELTNGMVYYYEGPYEINPSTESQSLSTANLVMKNNININKISYQEISNSSGGYTATIGN